MIVTRGFTLKTPAKLNAFRVITKINYTVIVIKLKLLL